MIIEVKIPLMSASEIETLIEHLNQEVYNHTGVIGESKISEQTIKSDNSKVIANLQAELEKAKEFVKYLKDKYYDSIDEFDMTIVNDFINS